MGCGGSGGIKEEAPPKTTAQIKAETKLVTESQDKPTLKETEIKDAGEGETKEVKVQETKEENANGETKEIKAEETKEETTVEETKEIKAEETKEENAVEETEELKAAREEEEKAAKEAEEKAAREAEEKAAKEAQEKAAREAEEKALREAEEAAAAVEIQKWARGRQARKEWPEKKSKLEAEKAIRDRERAEKELQDAIEQDIAAAAAGPQAAGVVKIRYNHYNKEMDIIDGRLITEKGEGFFCLESVFDDSFLKLADKKFPGVGVSSDEVFQYADQLGPNRYINLENGKEYWVHISVKEDEQKRIEEERKANAAKRLIEQKQEAEQPAVQSGEDNSSCSCLFGNPCVVAYNCKDWDNRFEVAKKNGMKSAH